MSTLALILIVVGALLVVFFVGGYLAARRRLQDPALEGHIRAADRALEQARASDRGWDRERMSEAAAKAISEGRPDYRWDTIDLVLVDDRPGVKEDRAELVASGEQGPARVTLARREGGDWYAEQVE
jgi:hypothetical protein